MPDHHPGLIPSGGVTKLSPNADLVQQRRCRGSGALHLSVRACVAPNQRRPGITRLLLLLRQFLRSRSYSRKNHGYSRKNYSYSRRNDRYSRRNEKRSSEPDSSPGSSPRFERIARRCQSLKGGTEQRTALPLTLCQLRCSETREGGAGTKNVLIAPCCLGVYLTCTLCILTY